MQYHKCDIWLLSCSCWRTNLPVVLSRNAPALCIKLMFCYYLWNQSHMSFARLCHLYIVEELINVSVISCPHLGLYSRRRYCLILMKKSVFIWLCKTSICSSIEQLYCTFSVAIISLIILCNAFQFRKKAVLVMFFFTLFSDPYPWPAF